MKTSIITTNHKICRALRGKMASSSSSSSSTSSTASTAVVAAAAAPAATAMAANQLPQQQDLHTDLLMQRQQQELIKLLAQHFHHQFYQMTAVNQTNRDQPSLNSPPSSDTLNINTSQQPIHSSYHHQQQRSHYTNEQNPFNSSSLNIAATIGNHQLSQNNHPLRSQSTSSGPHSTGGCNMMNSASESRDYLEYSNQNLTSAYPINDLSLFNALGLNLTNNQLVLSLQQQQHSLLQAAAMRQSELRNGFESPCNRNINNSDELLTGINQTKNGEVEHQDIILNHQHQQQQQQNQHRPDRKQHNLLKFSINTILGSSGGCGTSPNCNGNSTGDAKSNHNQSTNQSSPSTLVNRVGNFSGREEANLLESEQQLCVEVMDCDHIESSSDSSSFNASTSSSIPQSANLLQSLASNDHRCAKIVGDVNSFSQVGNAQHPLRQQHSQSIQQHHYHNQPLPFLLGSTAFPWTVAARGKPRRGMMRRAVFSDSQRVGLEKRFQLQKYISKPDRKKLAEKLGLRDSQVKIWFQNRRMKWRNSKERELLSAGGSREQTLPTRNNPNPDLSDVGETIKRISNSTTATPTVP